MPTEIFDQRGKKGKTVNICGTFLRAGAEPNNKDPIIVKAAADSKLLALETGGAGNGGVRYALGDTSVGIGVNSVSGSGNGMSQVPPQSQDTRVSVRLEGF